MRNCPNCGCLGPYGFCHCDSDLYGPDCFKKREKDEDTMTERLTHTTDEPDELYAKYRVFREPLESSEHPVQLIEGPTFLLDTIEFGRVSVYLNEVEEFTFVLKPDTDQHARVALAAYAESVRPFKPQLAKDLTEALELIEAP